MSVRRWKRSTTFLERIRHCASRVRTRRPLPAIFISTSCRADIPMIQRRIVSSTRPTQKRNGLSKLLDAGVWQSLSRAADATLRTIESDGWEAVFGTTKRLEAGERLAALTQAVGAATVRTKPWSDSRK